MKSFSRVKAAFALTALSCGGSALACQYEFAPEPIGGPSARFIMPRMFAAATFVDLALVEGSQTIVSLPGGSVPEGLYPEALSFRTVQRWKGSSPDRFILFGAKGHASRQWDMTHWTDEQGRIYPHMSVREAALGALGPPNSCSPPPVSAKPGSLHVIFREADGRLLGALPFHADMREVAGTSIAEVGPLWPETEWAREARVAGAYAKSMKLPAPAEVPDPKRATVRFDHPLAPAEVKALLEQTGAVPFGVTLQRGERTIDYRLASDVAMHRLIDDAVAWAQGTSTPKTALTTHAGALLDAYSLGSLYPDGEHHRFAADILRLAREPQEQGPVAISAVQVVAATDVQQVLVRRPGVLAVLPARRIRNRVLIDMPAPAAAELPTPIAVHRGLAAVAGRNVAASDLSGKWRLVASFTPLEEEALTLEFAGDQVRATMPCAAASTSAYRIEGQILEFALPKPDLKACPKRRAFWTAADIFDKSLFTVRLAGKRMRLLTDNGGDYEFAR